MKNIMKKLLVILVLFSCATPLPYVETYVDAFGDSGISKSVPIYFSTESLGMQDKQITKLCEDAAKTKDVNVINQKCDSNNCLNVFVTSRLHDPIQRVRNYSGADAWGTYTSSSDQIQREREIKISFMRGETNTEAHVIVIKSSGGTNSVAGVALEMCKAAFFEYPNHLTSKYYEVNVIR